MVVAVLLGSVRSERMGDRAAKWAVAQLEARGHEAVLVDAAELKLPMLDKMWKEIKHDPPAKYAGLHAKLAPLAELYARADGFCVVSGEYNHSIPPGLSNLIDHFLEEYFFRPSAIVCYSAGAFGGVRAAMAFRMVLAELGMPSIPSILPVPRVQQAFSRDGVPANPDFEQRSERFFAEFEWYAHALRAARASKMAKTSAP